MTQRTELPPTLLRAIVIDATRQAIFEVEIEDKLSQFYQWIGCTCMDAVRPRWLASGDVLFVDDEGLLKPNPRWFQVRGFAEPLAGNGLIVGSDAQGETTSAKTSLASVRLFVRFQEDKETRLVDPR